MKHIFASLLAGSMLLAAPLSAQTLSIEGGGSASTTGLLPQAFAPYAAEAGYNLQVVLDQVLTRSIMKVAAGQLDLSVGPPTAFRAMQRGVGPYAENAEQAMELSANVRSLFAFQGSTMHPTVWADSGIETWEDIRGLRVFVGPPAGAAAAQSTGMVEAASGLVAEQDYEIVRLPWGQATQAFQDGQFDVYIAFFPIGSQSIAELGLQRQVRILGIPDDVVGSEPWAEFEQRSGVAGVTIPAGTYGDAVANGDVALHAGADSMMIVVNVDMDEQTAYDLTKAYFEALPEMMASNALLASQNPDRPFFGITARLHPGAIRYFQEVGINIPEDLM